MNEGSFGFLLQEKDRLQDHLMQTTFKLGAGQSLEAWKVDYELATSLADQVRSVWHIGNALVLTWDKKKSNVEIVIKIHPRTYEILFRMPLHSST